ncbi:MAG: hypothetical protein Q8K05_14590 [Polaromonas sp.]|jgi:hypothetical protein|nr:hypothetical protein [Polaromonas sp.]MDP2257258.1 hypothetical protein [Polaromonas sp.]MDP3707609.1 hypothetical protein [Polaromonas sp.]
MRPDGTLYCGANHAVCPPFQDLLGAVDFAIAKDSPAHGEYTAEV